MKIIETEARDLAAEHSRYLERITPIIRNRLASRGASEAEIAAYIAEVPAEHFMIHIRSAIAATQLRGSSDRRLTTREI